MHYREWGEEDGQVLAWKSHFAHTVWLYFPVFHLYWVLVRVYTFYFRKKKLKLKLNIHFGSLNLHQEVSMYLPASPVCVWDGGWRNSVRGARIWQCQCLCVSLQHGWKSVLHSRRVIKHMALQDSHGTSLMVALLLKITGLFLLSGKFQGSYLSLNITFSFRWNPGLTGTILWQF